MKLKQLSAAVIAATAAASGAYAQDVTVYGKVNVSMNQTESEETTWTGATASVGPFDYAITTSADTQDNWELNSNASRVGVKGSYPINDSLKAIYKLEYEVYVDDGDDGSGTSEFKQRNIYGGFQGNWGTAIAGKFDTPTKVAQGKIDRFNDLPLGDIKNVFQGENRESNTVQYTSPTMAGFVVSAAFMPGEDNGIPGDDNRDGLIDMVSVSGVYSNGGLYLAAAADLDVDDQDLLRLVGEYDFGRFKIGAMVQSSDSSSEAEDASLAASLDALGPVAAYTFAALTPSDEAFEQDGIFVSFEMKVTDDLIVKAQRGVAESETHTTDYYAVAYTNPVSDVTRATLLIPTAKTTKEEEAELTTIGIDYKLSKTSKLYAYYSMYDNDIKTKATNVLYTIDEDEDASTFGMGYEIKF